MVPSTKLITIREAANRLGLKESTIRKYILKRQIAYVKPSVRAVRIPIEELERILAAGLRPVIPQARRCTMSRWKEFRREPVAGEWTRKQKAGLSPRTVPAVVLGVPSVPSALGDTLHGRRRGCGEAHLSSQATASTDRTAAGL
jgi:excisionase family DNA binding protein